METKFMKRILILVLVLASVTWANAQTKPSHRNEKVENELKELVRLWDAAMVKRDVKTLDRLLADEFTLSGTPKPAYLAFIGSPDTVIESAVSDNFDVRVYGDMAILIANDTVTSRRNGAKVVEVYRYIDVWVKRDGRWQCVATESYQIKKP
jgi:ketosteroid isomerase-like protein